jgi:hypothetical protein
MLLRRRLGGCGPPCADLHGRPPALQIGSRIPAAGPFS